MTWGPWPPTLALMGSDDEADLAPLYVAILDLLDAGVDRAGIAAQLGLDIEAVPGLVELATAKRRSRPPLGGRPATG